MIIKVVIESHRITYIIMQRSLDSWIQSKKTSDNIKTIFYLEWSQKPIATWYHKDTFDKRVDYSLDVSWRIPPIQNYIKNVNRSCRAIKLTIRLCGTLNYNRDNTHFEMGIDTKYSNVSYLQSHLQKCIRKGKEDIALATAKHLIRLDILTFLRRILIIMIEDVRLHESFPVILWLMVAKSNQESFDFSRDILEWLLGVVYMLCKHPHYYGHACSEENSILVNDIIPSWKLLLEMDKQKANLCTLVYSLIMRMSFGGLHGDMRMLIHLSHDIAFQRQSYELVINDLIRRIIWEVDDLPHNRWDLDAIDFHVMPRLPYWISKKYPQYSEEEIKKMMWTYSSSLNWRISKNEHGSDGYRKWHTILPRVRYLQRNRILQA